MDIEHPFVLAHYRLKTPDITRLIKQIKFWTFASIKGAMITGEKRVGKSYAIEFLMENIDKVVGRQCYCFSVEWKKQLHFNDKKFWTRLLKGTGFDTTLPGDGDRLEDRFYERVTLRTEDTGLPVCFMFIDESQNITPTEFIQLCHAFNELEKRKIRLYTLLVGQYELTDMKTLMREANCGQVIARFMEHTFEMRGITSARTLKSLLTQIDKAGYTKDAAPESVAAGFKLSDIAATLWKAKGAVDTDYSRPCNTPWTMQRFQSVLAVILQQLKRRGPKAAPLMHDDFEQIIKLIETQKSFSAEDDED